MHTSRTAVAWATLILSTVTLWVILGFFSASEAQAKSKAEVATEVIKKPKARKPKPEKGYGETLAERDRRLLRECKGRPNAGACEGYTH
jgi:hypothetical protein